MCKYREKVIQDIGNIFEISMTMKLDRSSNLAWLYFIREFQSAITSYRLKWYLYDNRYVS